MAPKISSTEDVLTSMYIAEGAHKESVVVMACTSKCGKCLEHSSLTRNAKTFAKGAIPYYSKWACFKIKISQLNIIPQ